METLVTTNKVVMAGEVRGPENYSCNYETCKRRSKREIGYEQRVFIGKISLLMALVFIVNQLISQ